MKQHVFQYSTFRGLRPVRDAHKSSNFLSVADNFFYRDGSLQTIEEIAQIGVLSDHPFPVLYRGRLKTLIMSRTNIYEYTPETNTVVSVLGSLNAAGIWTVADYGEFLIITDGSIYIVRDPMTKTYSITSAIPLGVDIVNYNGQTLILGAAIDA